MSRQKTRRRAQSVLQNLAKFPVRGDDPIPAYDAAAFGDATGPNRTAILKHWHRPGREGVPLTHTGADELTVSTGRWRDRLSGDWITDASDLEVAHLVSLPAAWEAGAHEWAPAKLARYASGIGPERDRYGWAVPVGPRLNFVRDGREAYKWLNFRPDRMTDTAKYVLECIRTKRRWGLSYHEHEVEFFRAFFTGYLLAG